MFRFLSWVFTFFFIFTAARVRCPTGARQAGDARGGETRAKRTGEKYLSATFVTYLAPLATCRSEQTGAV